jgi:hypothetical protein
MWQRKGLRHVFLGAICVVAVCTSVSANSVVNTGFDVPHGQVGFYQGDNDGQNIQSASSQYISSGYSVYSPVWVNSGYWATGWYWHSTFLGGYWVSYQYWVDTSHYVDNWQWVDTSYTNHYLATMLSFAFDTASLLAPGTPVSAELFLDLENVNSETPVVFIEGTPVYPTSYFSQVPIQNGPFGAHAASADTGNVFIDLTPYLNQMKTDSAFTIIVSNASPERSENPTYFRLDGLNLQAELEIPTPIAPVPEPLTMTGIFLGCMGVGSYLRLRLHV